MDLLLPLQTIRASNLNSSGCLKQRHLMCFRQSRVTLLQHIHQQPLRQRYVIFLSHTASMVLSRLLVLASASPLLMVPPRASLTNLDLFLQASNQQTCQSVSTPCFPACQRDHPRLIRWPCRNQSSGQSPNPVVVQLILVSQEAILLNQRDPTRLNSSMSWSTICSLTNQVTSSLRGRRRS